MRGYLFVMVMAILLPVVLFAAILFWRYYDSELARIEQELQTNARDLALFVDRDLQGELIALETLSTSDSMSAHDYARFYDQAQRIRQLAPSNCDRYPLVHVMIGVVPLKPTRIVCYVQHGIS